MFAPRIWFYHGTRKPGNLAALAPPALRGIRPSMASKYKPVVQNFIRTADKIYQLTYEDGTVIETTWSHPFYIEDRGWVKAEELRAGDVSKTDKGTLRISKVHVDPRSEEVYNFEVAENHTYLVTDQGVVVHNAGYKFDVQGNRAVLRDTGNVLLKKPAELTLVMDEDGKRVYLSADGRQGVVVEEGLFSNTSTVTVKDGKNTIISRYDGDITDGADEVDSMEINNKEVRSGDMVMTDKEGTMTVLQFSNCYESGSMACFQNMAAQLPEKSIIHSVGVNTDQHFGLEQRHKLAMKNPGRNVVLQYLDIGPGDAFRQIHRNELVLTNEARALNYAITSGKVTDLSCYSGGCGFQGQVSNQIDEQVLRRMDWAAYGGSMRYHEDKARSSLPLGFRSADFYYAGDDYVGSSSLLKPMTPRDKTRVQERNPNYRFHDLKCTNTEDCHNFYEYEGKFKID